MYIISCRGRKDWEVKWAVKHAGRMNAFVCVYPSRGNHLSAANHNISSQARPFSKEIELGGQGWEDGLLKVAKNGKANAALK